MITSPELQETLQSLGLSKKEADIYLASLELGPSLQLPLAQKAGLVRTSMRELIPDLLARNILQETIKGKRTFLVARDPRDLVADLQEKAARATQTLPMLLALQNERQEKPQIRFYEGLEGIKRVFEETLKVGLPIHTFVNVASVQPDLENWLVNWYVPQRHLHKIMNYVIVSKTAIAESLIPDDEYRKNLFIDAEKFPFKMEIDIFGDYVSLIHFSKFDTPTATLIQSQSAATTLRSIHQLIWEQ